MAYHRTIERILESIESVPILGSIITYPARHPIKSLFIATLGLIGAKHTGLIDERAPWLNTAATRAMTTSSNIITRFGENIGGYHPWLSSGAQLFSRATQNLFVPPVAPAP